MRTVKGNSKRERHKLKEVLRDLASLLFSLDENSKVRSLGQAQLAAFLAAKQG